jgi:4-diphosphocytidyl-2C-methyl-D-erythritol 2-phosphate synthase
MLKWLKFQNNALEKIVISKFPVVSKILKELSLLKNCQFSRITGSGSACFGVFLNKKDAAAGLVKIKKKFPKFWFAISRTI